NLPQVNKLLQVEDRQGQALPGGGFGGSFAEGLGQLAGFRFQAPEFGPQGFDLATFGVRQRGEQVALGDGQAFQAGAGGGFVRRQRAVVNAGAMDAAAQAAVAARLAVATAEQDLAGGGIKHRAGGFAGAATV